MFSFATELRQSFSDLSVGVNAQPCRPKCNTANRKLTTKPAAMATSSVLYAAAKEIGATCDAQNRAFLKCKMADEDPAACLDKGEAVQSCALGVLKSAMATCEKAFQTYATCLDNQISQEYMFERCRKQEHAFAECRQKAKGAAPVVAAAPSEHPSPQ